MTDRDCHHGELSRYGRKESGTLPLEPMPDGFWTPWHVAAAEQEALRHDIERQHEACSEHLAEIERLLAFVRAYDAYETAAEAWAKAGRRKLKETDTAFDETLAAMLEARTAVGEVK